MLVIMRYAWGLLYLFFYLIVVLSKSSEKLRILFLCANRYTQTVFAKFDAGSVSDDDTSLNKVIVDRLSIRHLCQEEISVGWINSQTNG